MSLPTAEQFPNDPENLPPARKRRAKRLLAPIDSDERAAFLAELAYRLSPSFDFFLFSLASSAVLAIGIMLDEPALLLLGALIAPMMVPVVGLALATIIGSFRFFFRSLAALLVGSAMVFSMGLVAGYLTQYWSPSELNRAYDHAQLAFGRGLLRQVGDSDGIAGTDEGRVRLHEAARDTRRRLFRQVGGVVGVIESDAPDLARPAIQRGRLQGIGGKDVVGHGIERLPSFGNIPCGEIL